MLVLAPTVAFRQSAAQVFNGRFTITGSSSLDGLLIRKDVPWGFMVLGRSDQPGSPRVQIDIRRSTSR